MPTEHTSQEHQQGHINGPPTQAGPRRDHHTSRAAQRPPCDPRHTDQPHPTINHTRPPNRDHSKLHWLFATTPGFSRDHIPTIHRIYATKPLVRTTINPHPPHCSTRPHPTVNGHPPRYRSPETTHPTQFATHQPAHTGPGSQHSPATTTPPIPRSTPPIQPRCFRHRHQPTNRTGDTDTHRDQPSQHPTFSQPPNPPHPNDDATHAQTRHNGPATTARQHTPNADVKRNTPFLARKHGDTPQTGAIAQQHATTIPYSHKFFEDHSPKH